MIGVGGTVRDRRPAVAAVCERWDAWYAAEEAFFGSVPNALLREWIARLALPSGARILSLGEGEGRDARWLARCGFRVTAVDGSRVGLYKLSRAAAAENLDIEVVCADLAEFEPQRGHYDLVISLFCHLPPALRARVHARAARALKPGGHLLVQGFARAQRELGMKSGGPPDIELLYDRRVIARELTEYLDTEIVDERRVVLDCGRHHGEAVVVVYCGRRGSPIRSRPASSTARPASLPHSLPGTLSDLDDGSASAPSPVVSLEHLRPGLWGKIEYLHPSGSLKHRSIPPFLERALACGELRVGQPVIIHSAGSAAIAAAWAGARLRCPVHALVPRSISPELIAMLEWLGARCHVVRSSTAKAYIRKLSADTGGYVLDQCGDGRLIDHYRPIADEILAQVPDVDVVVAGIGTGMSITGIGRQMKHRRPRCAIVGVEPAEARIVAGQKWTSHQIPGLAPPMPQPHLDRAVIDALRGVSSRDAWATARRLARTDGLLVGAAAGATVAAALAMDRPGAVTVAILSGSLAGYLSRYAAGYLSKPPTRSGLGNDLRSNV